MIFKLSLRNIFRNHWRSGLTIGGIAIATALLIWLAAFMDGMAHLMVRGTTAVEIGQVQIHDPQYAERAGVHHHFAVDDAFLDEVSAVEGVTGATPRVHLFGLVGHEETSQITRIVGVEPEREAGVTIIGEAVIEGRWLSAQPAAEMDPREAVLGYTLASLLEVEVGDELAVFLQAADGSLGNDLLRIVGIVRSGNIPIDRQRVYMHLEDAQFLGALDARVHEVATRRPHQNGHLRRRSRRASRRPGWRHPRSPDQLVLRRLRPGHDPLRRRRGLHLHGDRLLRAHSLCLDPRRGLATHDRDLHRRRPVRRHPRDQRRSYRPQRGPLGPPMTLEHRYA